MINSFNEWPEGSYIEPSQAYGGQFLGLSAEWSQQFKEAVVFRCRQHWLAAPLPIAPPAPEATATPVPEPDTPTAFVEAELLNLRDGPEHQCGDRGNSQHRRGVANSWAFGSVPNWWQVQNGEGLAWVYGPLVRVAGPLEQVPVVETAVPLAAKAPSADPALTEDATASMANQPILSRQP